MISVYNKHNSDIRPIDEDTVNDEMFVAWNGPEMGDSYEIMQKSLNRHFENTRMGIHFKMQNLFKTAGPTVDSILDRKNKTNMY